VQRAAHKVIDNILCQGEVLAQSDGWTGFLGEAEHVILHDCTLVFPAWNEIHLCKTLKI